MERQKEWESYKILNSIPLIYSLNNVKKDFIQSNIIAQARKEHSQCLESFSS